MLDASNSYSDAELSCRDTRSSSVWSRCIGAPTTSLATVSLSHILVPGGTAVVTARAEADHEEGGGFSWKERIALPGYAGV